MFQQNGSTQIIININIVFIRTHLLKVNLQLFGEKYLQVIYILKTKIKNDTDVSTEWSHSDSSLLMFQQNGPIQIAAY